MTAMLTSRELVTLYTKLEAPLIVSDLLDRGAPLGEDEAMALTVMIAEMRAEHALISLACCMQSLASYCSADPGLAASLKLQADFILDDYGPLWLRQQAGRAKGEDREDWLSFMQEDFEAAADLLMLCADIFGPETAAAGICRILQDQASSHGEALAQQGFLGQPEISQALYSDNIIPFPVIRRA